MKKANNISNNNEGKPNKKSDEYRSLKASKKELVFLKELKDISDSNQESPDFVFINKSDKRIGIEHFVIDISMGSRDGSGIRMTRGKARTIYNKYHKDIENNIDSAREEIERVLNQRMREFQDFNYCAFCERFNAKFSYHFSKINEYKKKWNLSSMGFLIEFLVSRNDYKISNDGERFHDQKLRDFPIAVEMMQIFEDALDELDFIILDTYWVAKKKDSIVLIDKENRPKNIFKEFAPLFNGEHGKVSQAPMAGLDFWLWLLTIKRK